MSSGNKRKTHIPSDFKRRKAKVGKRAPLPANNTDTSFKAATVQIRNQSIETSSSKTGRFLLSARGRSLQELSHQLHHPAGAVRLSAVRGLCSIIEETSSDVLVTHLSLLLPVISKCASVDEEENVRNVGLTALQLLIRRTIHDDADIEMVVMENRTKLWNSFVPLITAYVTSALHSLDRSTRLDGSRAVDILSRSLTLGKDIVANMLPAYSTLLQDYCQYENSTNSQKKEQNKKRSKRMILLQALVSLLQSIKKEDNYIHEQPQDPDLIINESLSPSTVHGLILLTPKQGRTTRLLPSLTAATLEDYGKILTESDLKVNNDNNGLSKSNLTNLFSKLRDIFVEILERGGRQLKNSDLEELSLLIQSIHLLWKNFTQFCPSITIGSNVLKQLWNMMRDSVPVLTNANQQEIATTVNGLLCLTVMEIGSSLNSDQQWTTLILNYLIPRLDASDFHAASTTMNVITSLLLNNTTKPTEETRAAALNQIADVYFSSAIIDVNTLRSAGARKAVNIATHTLQEQYGVWRHEEQYIPGMIQHLLDYLLCYKDDFLPDSIRIVETLLHCVHRIILPSSENNTETIRSLQVTLREGLVPLFECKNKREKCIFQLYPPSLQHKIICLIVVLQSPPDKLVQSLSKLSFSNDGISRRISKFIVEAMHLTRRTISMQRYLGFIISSIGIPNKKSSDNLIITSLDLEVRRASRALRRCGSAKVLPMMQGVLSSWLSSIIKYSNDDQDGSNDNYCLIRFRAALLIVAVVSHDLGEQDLYHVVPDLCHTLIKCCIAFFTYCSWDNKDNIEGRFDLFSIFERPIITLFKTQPQLLKSLAEEIANTLEKDDVNSRKILSAVHEIIQHLDLPDAIRAYDAAWMKAIQTIVLRFSNGPNMHQAQVLLTSLQLVIGNNDL